MTSILTSRYEFQKFFYDALEFFIKIKKDAFAPLGLLTRVHGIGAIVFIHDKF